MFRTSIHRRLKRIRFGERGSLWRVSGSAFWDDELMLPDQSTKVDDKEEVNKDKREVPDIKISKK